MKNRRQARKGEVTCNNCKHHFVAWWSKRLRCHLGSNYVTGKKYTCDFVEEKEAKC